MRILIVNMYYSPNMIGGAEHSVKLLAEGCVNAGHDVAVLTMDGARKGISIEKINGVLVFRAYSKSIYRRRILANKSYPVDMIMNGIHSIWNPEMAGYTKQVIDRFKPDVVHTNNLVSMSYWIWQYCAVKRIPLIHTIRDYWLLDPTTIIGGSNKIASQVFRQIMRRKSNKYVSYVTAPSKKTLEIFTEAGYFKKSDKECIVNSIDFSEELLRDSVNAKLDRGDKRIRFLYSGYLSENKGIKVLLEELEKVKKDYEMVFCGDGPLLPTVQQYAGQNDRVIVRGKISKKEMEEEYRTADVLIVPSLWEEPFGRIVIEAAQYATPSIGSDRGGIPETITALQFGTVVQINSQGELASCISKYANRSYLKEVVSAGPHNLEQYRIENHINAFISAYEKTAALVREK